MLPRHAYTSWAGARVRVALGILYAALALATSDCLRVDSPQAVAGQPSRGGEIGWVGLFSEDLVAWLENENLLVSLCGREDQSSRTWQACRAEKMAPKSLTVRLFAGPTETSSAAGSLLLVATPGVPLRVAYASPDGGAPAPFTPDLFDPDWGYGPYFHETFLERRGGWFRLPAGPFPPGTWLNAADLGPEPRVRLLQVDEVVTSPQGDLLILTIEPETVRARPEQEADKCSDTDPPPLKPFTARQIPLRDLYDAQGHLLLHVKYTRGC